MRRLMVVRHGHADPFGELTEVGRRQSELLGERLAHVRVDAIWHSPLARAVETARTVARHLPGVASSVAVELVDHVPYVPAAHDLSPGWRPFFDGYDESAASEGHATAQALVRRFAGAGNEGDSHELLVTHAYPIAWLVREALGAPSARWLGLDAANTGLTVIEVVDGCPTLVCFNDLAHLPPDLRWTGLPGTGRP